MKNLKLLLIIILIALTAPAIAQFRDKINVSLFAGGSVAQQNAYNQGYWYGLYIDYMLITTPNFWNFGLCALTSETGFKSNNVYSYYNGTNFNLGAGITMGKYFDYLTDSKSGYFGSNLLIKSNQDDGEGHSLGSNGVLGKYSMTQKDVMIAGELNINILKRPGESDSELQENIFPRSQLRLTFQEPLNSRKYSYWNDVPINESALWNKASYGAEFKQSIYQIGHYDLLCDPKLIAGYNYFKGDQSNWWIGGGEIALKKRGWDDFLEVFFVVKQEFGKFSPNLNSTQFVLGTNIMLTNLR